MIDIYNDTNFDENIGLQEWAKKENLKIAANTYNIMVSKNIGSFSELSNAIDTLKEQSHIANNEIKLLERKLKDFAEIIKYAEQYKENEPYHKRYESSKNKENIYRKCETQLILFDGAKHMLNYLNIDPKNADIVKLKVEYQKLLLQKNELYTSIKKNKKEMNELELIQKNMDKYLNTYHEKEKNDQSLGV